MKKKILGVLSTVTVLFAVLCVSTASSWILYQPKAPKLLQK